jgi:hypothetical protein
MATAEIVNNKDWQMHKLTPSQARAVIAEAATRLAPTMKGRKTATRPQAPKVAAGNTPRGGVRQGGQRKADPASFSREDRRKLLNLL